MKMLMNSNASDPGHWNDIYEQSGYRLSTIAELSKIDEGSIRQYFWRGRIPRKPNYERMVIVMDMARKLERLKHHPSYGYATQEQIDRLKAIGVGVEMDMILKEIAEQTRNRGKYK